MTNIQVPVTLGSTRPIPSYNEYRTSKKLLDIAAAAYNEGSVPFLWHHDFTQPASTRVLNAVVVATDDGEFELNALLEVDEDDWNKYKAHLLEVGAPGGFSMSFTEAIGESVSTPGADAVVGLYANAAHFSDEQIIEAATFLTDIGNAYFGRSFQLSVEPLSSITIHFLEQAPFDLLLMGLYDAVKSLFRSRKSKDLETTVQFDVIRNDGGSIRGIVKTSNEEVALAAIQNLQELMGKENLAIFDENSGWQNFEN